MKLESQKITTNHHVDVGDSKVVACLVQILPILTSDGHFDHREPSAHRYARKQS